MSNQAMIDSLQWSFADDGGADSATYCGWSNRSDAECLDFARYSLKVMRDVVHPRDPSWYAFCPQHCADARMLWREFIELVREVRAVDEETIPF